MKNEIIQIVRDFMFAKNKSKSVEKLRQEKPFWNFDQKLFYTQKSS